MKPVTWLIPVLYLSPWTQILGLFHWYFMPRLSLWTQDAGPPMQNQVSGPSSQIQAVGLNQWTQGSRTSLWTQAPVMIPDYASTRPAHLLTQAQHLDTQWLQQQTCTQKPPGDPLRISGQAEWWRMLSAEACCKDWKRCLFPLMCRH